MAALPCVGLQDGDSFEVVTILLTHGAELDSRDQNGWTPLFWALQAPRTRRATLDLLLERGADPNGRDNQGRTPLLVAAEASWNKVKSQNRVFDTLLEKGVDLYVQDKNGRTPLSWAAGFANHGVVKLLLEKGIDRETTDNEGRTAVWWAEYLEGDDYETKTEDEVRETINLLATWGATTYLTTS
ncbi:ankyrin repeat-containing domain protein [Aspergillus cavernicola]|uniref:Ankyrin repeat-containing domain protein n=1 Tax=Aspergillus cavernicola TaxID=176166 RepID=A0ABR4I8F6_9EURO